LKTKLSCLGRKETEGGGGEGKKVNQEFLEKRGRGGGGGKKNAFPNLNSLEH